MLKSLTIGLFVNSISAIDLQHRPRVWNLIQGDDEYSKEMSCTANINRLDKAQEAKEWEKAQAGDNKWMDKTFTGPHALYWEEFNKDAGQMSYYKDVKRWSRPTSLDNSPLLWGSQGVLPAGVKQGHLSDCWFLASASALAEFPERIMKIFKNADYSKKGVFQMTFYHKGMPKIVTIDDLLPLNSSGQPFNAKKSWNGAWWLPLLEKAYAKFNVNYSNLGGGLPGQALRELTGMPVEVFDSNKQGIDEFYNVVAEADKKKYSIVAACINPYASLVTGHAYSVLGVLELTVNDQVVQKLLKMRNPWGQELYSGPWNDRDNDNWTPDFLRQAGGHVQTNYDGLFYMPAEDFKKAFTLYSIVAYKDWNVSQSRIQGTGKQFKKFFIPEDDQEIVVSLDYQNKKQLAYGCEMPEFYYNIYVIAGRKVVANLPINRQIAHGSKSFQVQKGQKYNVIIINWKDATAESDMMFSLYSEKAVVQIQ